MIEFIHIAILSTLDITLVVSVLTVSVATMATLIRVFGVKKISDEVLRKSEYIKSIDDKSDMVSDEILRKSEYIKSIDNKIDNRFNKSNEDITEIRNYVQKQQIEIEKMKISTENNEKNINEVKKDNKELVQRLDELLRQFLDYIDN